MQVKKTHFLKTFPGMPVYEMENGTLRIPYTDKDVNRIHCYSEHEVNVLINDDAQRVKNRAPFQCAMNDILQERQDAAKDRNMALRIGEREELPS